MKSITIEGIEYELVPKSENKKDWEILEFDYWFAGNTCRYKKHGKDDYYWCGSTVLPFDWFKFENVSIVTVKRLSDYEVFQINDIDARWGKIEQFVIINGRYLNALCNDGNPKPIHVQLMELKKAYPPTVEKEAKKPPLGIMPEWIWKEERRKGLLEAIRRYAVAELEIPLDWITEEYTLSQWLKMYHKDKIKL